MQRRPQPSGCFLFLSCSRRPLLSHGPRARRHPTHAPPPNTARRVRGSHPNSKISNSSIDAQPAAVRQTLTTSATPLGPPPRSPPLIRQVSTRQPPALCLEAPSLHLTLTSRLLKFGYDLSSHRSVRPSRRAYCTPRPRRRRRRRPHP